MAESICKGSDKGLIYRIRDYYPECIENSYNSTTKKETAQSKNGLRTSIVLLQRRYTNEYTKRCSTSLMIREMQIKTTMRNDLESLKMAIIYNTHTQKRKTRSPERTQGNYNPFRLLVGM